MGGGDRPATSADIDRLMASITTLSGKFGADVASLCGTVDAGNAQVVNLTEEVKTDRCQVNQGFDELTTRLDQDRVELVEVVKDDVDTRLAEFGMGSGDSRQMPAHSPASQTKEDLSLIHI